MNFGKLASAFRPVNKAEYELRVSLHIIDRLSDLTYKYNRPGLSKYRSCYNII